MNGPAHSRSDEREGPRRRRSLHIPAFRIRKPPGTAPGTIEVDPAAPKPVITVIGYGPDAMEEQRVDSVEQIPELLGRWPVVWINVDGLGDRDVVARLGEILRLHPLALEDVVNVHQRAKVEPYEDHLFVVARMARQGERLETEQVSFFVGSGFLLTFQERVGDDFDLVRQRIRSGRKRIRGAGPDYLCYALLDALVDAYFAVLEGFSERLQALEDRALGSPDKSTAGDIHEIRRELLRVRRAIWPHREALSSLLRDELAGVSETTRLHLRDVYDHAIQIIDMVETYREIASGLMDLYLSGVSNRLNEIMKVLTIFAAIFIPLSFIAGIYGMNFDTESPWNMPELSWSLGYPFAIGLMVLTATSLLAYFWFKGWIGR
ncbi:MAG: magnesium/cobalt transporter CorA [Planctomycetota bacterium]|jgi:magnesium transporter